MGQLECKPIGRDFADPASEYKCNGDNFCRARVGLTVEAVPVHDELLDGEGGEVFEDPCLDQLGLYFMGPYRFGAPCAVPGYVPSQRYGVDALLHEKTGVLVWSQALDFCGTVGALGAGESATCEARGLSPPPDAGCACVFHYAGEVTFKMLARQALLIQAAAELLAADGPFGRGLHACRKPPHLFESRGEILVNVRWPRRCVVEECGGNAQLGPHDRHNTCLRRRLLHEHGTASVGFCVPVLCRAEHLVSPLWPGGRNRWDEPQPQWLDASLVCVPADHQRELALSVADAQIRVLRLRVDWHRAGNANGPETLSATKNLERALSDVRAQEIAESESENTNLRPLQREGTGTYSCEIMEC